MGLFSKVWDWIEDAVESVMDWFYDLLADLRDWVISGIAWLTEEIRVLKWKFRSWLSNFMQNPLGFWIAASTFVLLVTNIPKITAWIGQTQFWLATEAIFKHVKDSAGGFLLKMAYIQALAIHRIALIFFVDYQKFWKGFDEAFCAMAEEIAIGVGTLNILSSSIRNLYFSTYTMLGIDADTIELRFYTTITTFWADKQRRWERYVRNPQLIFTDIQQELVFPILDEQAKLGSEKAAATLKMAKDIDTNIYNINDVREKFNAFLDALPAEIRDAVFKHMGPFIDFVNDAFDNQIMPFMAKVDQAIAIIDETIEGVQEAIELNSHRKQSALDDLIDALFDFSVSSNQKRQLLNELFSRIYSPDSSTLDDIDSVNRMTYSPQEDDVIEEYKYKKEDRPSSIFGLDFSKVTLPIGGWYVGEY